MSEFLWLLVAAAIVIWGLCVVVVAAIGVAAHRGDPRVIVDDPYESAHTLTWDCLRDAVLRANAGLDLDLDQERSDFTRWEVEVRARRSRRAA
jgi:hypothetical protein